MNFNQILTLIIFLLSFGCSKSGVQTASSPNPTVPTVANADFSFRKNFLQDTRTSHTSTLLSSGNVLVIGGYGDRGHLSSVELYDAKTDSWIPQAKLGFARSGHTTTLLANGKLLVVGGVGDAGDLNSVELYDPGFNSWSNLASLTAARNNHTATLLTDGKVLVIGGPFSF
jgi:N-acetylneuraminic acid mutarotase